MVSFVASLVVTAMCLAVYHWYEAKVPLNKKMTWGEAMVTSTFVFFIFFWVYGVVPHFWLEWADKDLNWRGDKFLQGPHIPFISNTVEVQETGEIIKLGVIADQRSGGWFPFTINYLHIRDIIAVVIYNIILGVNIWYWGHWQSREARAADAEKSQETPSEFGRPLVREGAR